MCLIFPHVSLSSLVKIFQKVEVIFSVGAKLLYELVFSSLTQYNRWPLTTFYKKKAYVLLYMYFYRFYIKWRILMLNDCRCFLVLETFFVRLSVYLFVNCFAPMDSLPLFIKIFVLSSHINTYFFVEAISYAFLSLGK